MIYTDPFPEEKTGLAKSSGYGRNNQRELCLEESESLAVCTPNKDSVRITVSLKLSLKLILKISRSKGHAYEAKFWYLYLDHNYN